MRTNGGGNGKAMMKKDEDDNAIKRPKQGKVA